MKKIFTVVIIVFCALLSSCVVIKNDFQEPTTEKPSTDTAATFEKRVIKTSELSAFKFWLYTPENAKSGLPLIVYLHGGSGKGDDLEQITAVDGFPKYLKDGNFSELNAYVVIPQLSADKRGWSDIKSSIKELVLYMQQKYGTDVSETSLTGHSMGGTGTWDIALAFPTLFSRIAPMSGSIKLTDTNIKKLANIQIRAFVGSADTIVSPSSSIDFISALSKINKNAQITVFDGAGHFDIPSLAYLGTDIVSWLAEKIK